MSPVEPSRTSRNAEAGFTLIELLVAMTVTLIITGAMYGLLAGGQNAFRREPELTDRQQAIRMGMDRIQRDVLIAGQKLGAFHQSFENGLNGAGNQPIGGGAGPLTGPNGPTDILQLTGNTGECPDVWADDKNIGANVEPLQDTPSCFPENGPVAMAYANGVGKPVWVHGGQSGTTINFPPGQNGKFGFTTIRTANDVDCPINRQLGKGEKCPATVENPRRVIQVSVVRYLIAPDPVDGVPSLWRSDFGGFSDSTSQHYDDPLVAPPDARWRLIARGVEDLQVQYRNGNTPINAWLDEPGIVDINGTDYSTIVREVRVTLGARTVQTNLAGARTSAQGGDAIRGQLVATVTPRAAMFYLGQQDLWH